MKKIIAFLLVMLLSVFCITSMTNVHVHADPGDAEIVDPPSVTPPGP